MVARKTLTPLPGAMGRNWTYAHNGQLEGMRASRREVCIYRETDSEKAFCWLLHSITERYPKCWAIWLRYSDLSPRLPERCVKKRL
ncbi:MAG: class II glutamine amidotransferase [Enterobacteriaceae bacterium]